MENGAISDGQITASSEWNDNHAANQGRLHFQAGNDQARSWSAKKNDSNQWLQVDLGNQHTKVTRVATQGMNKYNQRKQWVKEYKLQYGNDTANLQNYTEQGQVTVKISALDLLYCTKFRTT